jgi:apolipoprotein N-acyltransferase
MQRMRRHFPGWANLGAAFGCGAVMALGQAPVDAWYLALPALSALTLLVQRMDTPGKAAWIGLFAGAGHFALALSWIFEPFLVEPETYAWMIPFVVVFLSFGLGLFWALAAALAVALAKLSPGPWRVALLWALTLAGAELARGYVLTGFPWALVGHIWIDTPLAQLAAFIGPNGLTLLTTLAAALPLAWGWSGLAVTGLALVGGFGFGAVQLAKPMPAASDAIVRLIQPNAEQHLKWDRELARVFFDRQLDLTAAAPAPGMPRPDLIVWPETALPYLLNDAQPVLQAIAQAAQGAMVAVGVQRVEGFRGYNSLAMINPDATIGHIYDKHHLVPFGEYLPFGDFAYRWLGISAFAAQEGNGYSAGQGPVLLDLGPKLGLALPLICYEAVFPQDLRAAKGRANFIMQLTNDAWFGKLTGPWQHLAQARLRAIEQGLPFLRSANTGVSAVIDARGRVLSHLPMGVAGHLDTALPTALAATFYAGTGDLPFLVLLIGLFALVVFVPKKLRP